MGTVCLEGWRCAERISLENVVSVGSVKPCGVMLHRTGDYMCGPLNYAQPLRPQEDQDAVFLEDEDERRK